MTGRSCTTPGGRKSPTVRAPVRPEWRTSLSAGLSDGTFGLARRVRV